VVIVNRQAALARHGDEFPVEPDRLHAQRAPSLKHKSKAQV
jgi:hypothetical protein